MDRFYVLLQQLKLGFGLGCPCLRDGRLLHGVELKFICRCRSGLGIFSPRLRNFDAPLSKLRTLVSDLYALLGKLSPRIRQQETALHLPELVFCMQRSHFGTSLSFSIIAQTSVQGASPLIIELSR